MEIRLAHKRDSKSISDIGQASYRATYPSILSEDQIAFMLNKNYTEAAIEAMMDNGQDFYILEQDEIVRGFIAVQQVDQNVLRIEKLYLLPETKGGGYGKALINFAVKLAKDKSIPMLELNVNRNNPAYYFYLKQGFTVTKEVDIPYYGYILDDYVMQKII